MGNNPSSEEGTPEYSDRPIGRGSNEEGGDAAPLQPSSSHMGCVLGKPMEADLSSWYTFEGGDVPGRGRLGATTLLARCAWKPEEKYSCKRISKTRMMARWEAEEVRREVQVMHHLTGQRNVVELKEAIEDEDYVYLIMQLCQGGELVDRIVEKGTYSERAAAALFRQIARLVFTCHSMGVMHRDLKPENFLFLTEDDDSPLMAADFGLSVFLNPGEKLRDLVGTVYYVAPEVLKCDYGKEADIWSAGVILYILLSGVPPFFSQSEKEIFDAIVHGNVDFSSEPWPSISSGAKDLIKRMLQVDPDERISIADVLDHPWLREDGDAPEEPLHITVIKRMKQFRATNKLKKLALKVVAENLLEEECEGLRNIFKFIDVDNSGTITFNELKEGLPKLGTKITESEVRQILEGADVDGNGTIDYVEFLTATMHDNRMYREQRLAKAFKYFDKDDNGFITMEEIEQALQMHNMGDEKSIKEIVEEVDTNKDGKISFSEFLAMMEKGNSEMPGFRPTVI